MISIIVAYSKNRVIGNKGKIPWKCKTDLQRFKKLTENNVVIMGRKTYEEIGTPLTNRVNIVISKTKKFTENNVFTANSLEDALEFAETNYPNKEIFISGGTSVYEKALEMDIVDCLYISVINKIVPGDRYFPKIDYTKWSIVNSFSFNNDDCVIFETYKRKKE